MTLSPSAISVSQGASVVYSLVITNRGPEAAPNVRVVNTLPGNVSFSSASVSQGAFAYANGVLTCALGSVPANGSASVSVTASGSGTGAGTFSTTVAGNALDPDATGNSAAVQTAVMGVATWVGGDGSWFIAANWQPAGVPGQFDEARIGTGTVYVEGNAVVGGLRLAGGVLTGSGNLTITGSGSWEAGEFRAAGGLTIAPGAVLSVSGSGNRVLSLTSVRNYGRLVWSADGWLGFASGAFFNNYPGAVFEFRTDRGLFDAGDSGGSFTNFPGAVFRKAGGVGLTEIRPGRQFQNDGVVEALTGTIQFATTLLSKGGIQASSGATVLYLGRQVFHSGSALVGAGTQRMAGGDSVFSGAITSHRFELAGGTVSGTFTNTGEFLWTGGVLAGGGTLTVPAGSKFVINSTGDRPLSGYSLDNYGTMVLTGAGKLGFSTGAAVNNRAGALFDLQADLALFDAGDSGGSFTNHLGALFRKTGGAQAGEIRPGREFWNNGKVIVSAGTLRFATTLANSGSIEAAPEASVVYAGNQAFSSGSLLTGPGSHLMVQGATLFRGSIRATRFELAGGTVSGTFTNTGEFLWTGGVLAGAGTLTIPGGSKLTINSAGNLPLNGYSLDNYGAIALGGPGHLGFSSGAAVNNRAGALFDLQADLALFDAGDSGGSFTNHLGAVFRKSAGAQAGEIRPGRLFWNNGQVIVSEGTLRFATTLANSGSIEAAPEASVVYAGNQAFSSGSVLTGPGSHLMVQGATISSGSIRATRFELAGGTVSGTFTNTGEFLWTGGDLAGGGTLTIPLGSRLTINSGANRTLSGYHLLNFGTALLAGSGWLGFSSGATVTNLGLFVLQTDRGLYDAGDSGGSFVNVSGATLRKSASPGTSELRPGRQFINSGIVSAESGTVHFETSLINAGRLHSEAGAALTYAANLTFADGTSFTGAGIHRMNSGNASFDGSISGSRFELAGGSASGTFAFAGQLLWRGGVLIGSGTMTLPSGSSLFIDTGGDRLLNAYHLDNSGSILVTGGGWLGFSSGAGILNRSGGSVDLQNTLGFFDAGDSGGSFRNSAGAVFRKSVATPVSEIRPGREFSNEGVLDLQAGILKLFGDYSPAPGSVLRVTLAGTTPGADFGQLSVAGSANLAGSLQLITRNGFVPASADTMDILIAAACSGTFSGVSGQVLQDGLSLEPFYHPAGVRLTVSRPPAFIETASARLENGRFSMRLRGALGQTVIIEARNSLAGDPWVPVSTNVITGDFIEFLESVAANSPSRFYRLVILPREN